MIHFLLNDKEIKTTLPAGMVVLDFIRYHQHLMGTKIGCREGDCGACTILVGEILDGNLQYRSQTSCLMPLGNAGAKHIVTIEGINMKEMNPIQQAMADEGATQCGFCTPGFVMSLAGFCLNDAEPTHQNAIAAMDGNICRCTGYKSIERAAGKISDLLQSRNGTEPSSFVAEEKILPEYFSSVKEQLKKIMMTSNGMAEAKQSKTFVGGGTDLYVQKHEEMTHAEIEFILDEGELRGISIEGNRCVLGGSTTVTDLCESAIIQKYFPKFSEYAKLISSTPIRNMATLAGNFVNASPIGDFTVFFLALNATLILSDGQLNREIPLRNFYKGYKQLDKKPEEIIKKMSFVLPDKNTHFNFEKVSKRTHLDIASVNSAMMIKIHGKKILSAEISAGGVAPIPTFLSKTSEFLSGEILSEAVIDEATQIAQTEISPISDARGSEEYKRFLLSQLIKAHFITLFPELEVKKILSY